jgi:thymidylate synthase (FAD)
MPGFEVVRIAATPLPQTCVYLALHNDYSEEFVTATSMSEEKCGEIAVQRLLKGNRGHYGPLEHAHMLMAIRADHNTIMQLRTHRLFSFDVQSMRYTGDRVIQVAEGAVPIKDVFSFRPPGVYLDREGQRYEYTEENICDDQDACFAAAVEYSSRRAEGRPEEDARRVLPTCYFQNAYVSGNLRSWLHLLDVRLKLDAQLEIRDVSERANAHIYEWAPQIAQWWQDTRAGKALLAP